jgi:hypothetical protein
VKKQTRVRKRSDFGTAMANRVREVIVISTLTLLWIGAVTTAQKFETYSQTEWYVRRDSNIRIRDFSNKSEIIGKARRGEKYMGKVVLNFANYDDKWLKIDSAATARPSVAQYIWLSNLSAVAPLDCKSTKLKSILIRPNQTTKEPFSRDADTTQTPDFPMKFTVLCRIGPDTRNTLFELAPIEGGGVIYGRKDGSPVVTTSQ